MPVPLITVAIASIRGGPLLNACLDALAHQTERDFEVALVDNTESGAVAKQVTEYSRDFALRVLTPGRNVGFAEAMNLAWQDSTAQYLVTLNDDAEPHPEWLAALVRAASGSPDIGMVASQVRLWQTGRIDSAGMLMARDGSSKQRGQDESAERFAEPARVLFPSASAALYRREMLDDIGLFDEDFFLYCEDTDLGLRARWNGWECVYEPCAKVDHHYSQSSGAGSSLKAWQIERNRLWVVAKNFPASMLWALPLHTAARYAWHLIALLQGHGLAGEFRRGGNGTWEIAGIVWRAHWSLIANASTLLRKRRAIRKGALITPAQFARLLRSHSISSREIARL